MEHRAHDYRFLTERWRSVARRSGVRLMPLVKAGKYPLFYLRTKKLAASPGVYLSAGIHGDEPAATEALVTWAEENAERLAELPLLIFPCLNPWGLSNNSRTSEDHVDLNRIFHRDDIPLIAAIKTVVGTHQFALAVMMHEDYDAHGLYVYEIEKERPFWGEALIEAARAVIPIEARPLVDGRKPNGGLIRRKIDHKRFLKMGYPEAIWLQLHHSARTFTVETPSEFALEQRIAGHLAVLRESIRRCLESPAR